jgi:dynein heavy chain, axonemal
MIRKGVTKHFGLNFDNVCAHLDLPDANGKLDGKINSIDEFRGLIWSDVLAPMGAKRYYEEITERDRLQHSVETGLSNYNMMTDKVKKNIKYRRKFFKRKWN